MSFDRDRWRAGVQFWGDAGKFVDRLAAEADDRGELVAGRGALRGMAKAVGVSTMEADITMSRLRAAGAIEVTHRGTGPGDPTRWALVYTAGPVERAQRGERRHAVR